MNRLVLITLLIVLLAVTVQSFKCWACLLDEDEDDDSSSSSSSSDDEDDEDEDFRDVS